MKFKDAVSNDVLARKNHVAKSGRYIFTYYKFMLGAKLIMTMLVSFLSARLIVFSIYIPRGGTLSPGG
jgi:hypothetical protein